MTKNIFQKLYHKDLQKVYGKFKGIIIDNIIGDIPDLQTYFENIRKEINNKDRILISYHNPSWEPILTFASKIGLRKKVDIQNWLDQEDLKNILELSGFEVVGTKKRFFGITAITIAKPKIQTTSSKRKEYSVSIIIPARNEERNIPKIIPSIPKFGKWQEIIFVEGNSKDKTWEEIINVTEHSTRPTLKLRRAKQTGKGKADAVKLGLSKANGDILIIYDADRTVDAFDLIKFYNALAEDKGKFINGSRLVYPMETDAMQLLNKIGNKFFGFVFTRILGTRFKDTLCGTKAIWRRDFIRYKRDYNRYLKTDPFGDFALIFTAIKHHLKVIEIPVRYKERVYGSTNINRFKHGILLFKMAFEAFLEFKI